MTRQSGSKHVWSGGGDNTHTVRGRRVSTGFAAYTVKPKLKKGKVAKIDQPLRARVITQATSNTDPALSSGTGGSILDLFGALSAYATGHTLSTTEIETAISDALSERHNAHDPDRRP